MALFDLFVPLEKALSGTLLLLRSSMWGWFVANFPALTLVTTFCILSLFLFLDFMGENVQSLCAAEDGGDLN